MGLRSSTNLITVVSTVVLFAVGSFPTIDGSSQCNPYSALRKFTNYSLPFVVGIRPQASKAWNITLRVPDINLQLEFYGQPTDNVKYAYTSKHKEKTKGSIPLDTGEWSYFDIFKENDQLHIYPVNISFTYKETQRNFIEFSIETSGTEYQVNCQGKCGISSPVGFSPMANHIYFLRAVNPGGKAVVCRKGDHYFQDQEWHNYTFGNKRGICNNVDASSNLLIADCDPRDESSSSTYSTLSAGREAQDATSSSTSATRIQENTGSSGSHDSERDSHTSTLNTEKEQYDLNSPSTTQDTQATVQEDERLKNPSTGRPQHAGEPQDHNTNMGEKATEDRDAGNPIPANENKGNLSVAMITIIFLICLLLAALVVAAVYRTRNGYVSFSTLLSRLNETGAVTEATVTQKPYYQPNEHVAGV